MTAVKIDKMRRQYDDQKKGGDMWTPEVGDTKLYIHPPCRDDDNHELTEGLNYVPLTVHYGVGKNNQMVICLDPEANPVLTHPFLRPFLKKRGLKLPGKCAVCTAIADGEASPSEAEAMKAKQTYLWGVTPLAYRARKADEWRPLPGKPSIAMTGKTLYEGFVELYSEVGDVSDFTGATLALVNREGKGKQDTKYKVSADVETTKKPLNVRKDAKLAAALAKALAEGGDCDLFRVAAAMIKSGDEVVAIMNGVKLDKSDDDDDDDSDDEDDESDVDTASEDEADDEDEVPPPKKKAKAPVEDEDDEEEEAPPKKKAKAPVEDEEDDEAELPAPKKKAKAPVEEDDDAEDEDEVPPPKKKAKAPVEDEDDEEEEAPPAKGKAKAEPVDDLDELDAELDRLSKKKKSA